MMIHEKFLLDLKNDPSSLLQQSTTAQQNNAESPSPPMPAFNIYSAYAYQQQLQHQLLNSHMTRTNPIPPQTNAAEVLDLSRKTPSPKHSISSLDAGSRKPSPNRLTVQTQQTPPLANNLISAAQAYQQAQNVTNLPITPNFAALYSHQYYPGAVKQEPVLITSLPPKTVPVPQLAPAIANNNNNSILKTFASAAAAAISINNNVAEPLSPQPASSTVAATTPTSSFCSLASSHDTKNTRPFKAFPRDPLVIAANFAATDVLLDNPRVERYTEYRKRVLEQIRSSNGGSRTVTNPKMRRTNSLSSSVHDGVCNNNSENDDRQQEESSDCDSSSGQEPQMSSKSGENPTTNENNNPSGTGAIVKDAAYYERRRKNNAAAKKSRDRRRIKEDEIAIRAAYLERQNIELLCQIDTLKAQVATLTAKKG